MAAKKKRIKAPALAAVPQSRDDVVADIAQIGICQRERQKIEAAMNDELAGVREKYESEAQWHSEEIARLSAGVKAYCEAHRVELTMNGKSKTVDFSTGSVSWRTRPPSVEIRGVDAVLEQLYDVQDGRFVRTKEEVNKEAILADPDAVSGVKGIKIKRDQEDFSIEPFETKLEDAKLKALAT